MSLFTFLKKIKDKNNQHLDYGREIVAKAASNYVNIRNLTQIKILDLGAGSGADLLTIKSRLKHLNVCLFAIENYAPNVEILNSTGEICVNSIDIEQSIYPFENEYFDIIIMNQVLEHTKEVFWIFSEISRVIKKRGLIIVGVPNLASFHNRIALLFGIQPTCIKVLSAHVRGFTVNSLKEFVETDGYFKLRDFWGAHFYLAPKLIAGILSKIFKSFSVLIFMVIERTDKDGVFIDALKARFFETPYFNGEFYR